jgi:hypothetical protein
MAETRRAASLGAVEAIGSPLTRSLWCRFLGDAAFPVKIGPFLLKSLQLENERILRCHEWNPKVDGPREGMADALRMEFLTLLVKPELLAYYLATKVEANSVTCRESAITAIA